MNPWILSLVPAVAAFATPSVAAAGESTVAGPSISPIVTSYSAPKECPLLATFESAVATELACRGPVGARLLPVSIEITRGPSGYIVHARSPNGPLAPFDRTVEAPTCDQATDIAAAVVALAQIDANAATTPAAPDPAPPPSPIAAPAPPPEHELAYSLTAGFGAFTAGPAEPVIRNTVQQFTFNPAIGARIGVGVSHKFGWWKQSVEASVAYYRQSSNTGPNPSGVADPPGASGLLPDTSDRDVLHATVGLCPVHFDYAFLSVIPCGTFSMIQSRGESGNSPGLETGIGADLRVRGRFAKSFFAEAMGAAVAHASSYEPVSRDVRLFYSLSLGVGFR